MEQKETNEQEWKNPDNWSVGFYFSKKDQRTWVPKQIPWMGWTMNIARPAGAMWLLGFLVGVPIYLVLMLVLTASGTL